MHRNLELISNLFCCYFVNVELIIKSVTPKSDCFAVTNWPLKPQLLVIVREVSDCKIYNAYASIQLFARSGILGFVPDVEIRRGAKYFGCADVRFKYYKLKISGRIN